MKILINNVSKIKSADLDFLERGILITLLLIKNPSPSVTEAAFKDEVKNTGLKFNDVKPMLANLHKLGYIEWKGFSSFMSTLKKYQSAPDIVEVIDFMNDLYGRKFDAHAENTVKELRNRLDKHGIEDVKLVVSNRWVEWKDDKMMQKYLNPGTIFRASKFEKYLEEARYSKKGSGIMKASSFAIKRGDEIKFKDSGFIVDTELYLIEYFGLDENGKRLGNGSGIVEEIIGKDLKSRLKSEDNKNKAFGKMDFVYTYLGK